jgi:hypothetical protein
LKSYNYETLPITYNGGDADRHEINLGELSRSLQGVSKILSTVSNFVITGRYSSNVNVHEIKIMASEPKAKCYQLWVDIQSIASHPMFSGFAGSAITIIVNYIIARNSGKKEEMKALSSALEKAIQELGKRDESTFEKLISTIDKMSDGLNSALRQAIEPVGNSCATLEIGEAKYNPKVIDQETKDRILCDDTELTEEQETLLKITELDLENKTCKVRICDKTGNPIPDSMRVKAIITDPSLCLADNPYAHSLIAGKAVRAKHKTEIKNGEIKKFFISDASYYTH